MAQEKLPRELVEEILYRVPPLSLTRLRTVCKQWNALFNDRAFIANYLALTRPQFLLYSNSKIYSVCVNPNDDSVIEMRELPFHIPYSNNYMPIEFIHCDGLLFCTSMSWNGAAVWNPWLRQTRWIESEEKKIRFFGIGYDSGRPQKNHKILGSSVCTRKLNDDTCQLYNRFAIYEFETNAWKCINAPSEEEVSIKHFNTVSIHGNLYWPAYNFETDEYLIKSFDFSKDTFKIFCVLPRDIYSSPPALSVFRRDRFSVLRNFTRTNKIEIWVPKDKINEDGENVVWMKFMTVSIPGFRDYSRSYFIDHFCENSLIICCNDENKNACIYIVKGNVSKKIELDLVVSGFSPCPYTPSLISVMSESLN